MNVSLFVFLRVGHQQSSHINSLIREGKLRPHKLQSSTITFARVHLRRTTENKIERECVMMSEQKIE